MKAAAKPVKRTKTADTFSAEEKAAMREYAAEKKKAKGGKARWGSRAPRQDRRDE